MSSIDELISEVKAAGAILKADPPDLVVKPAGVLPDSLKARLKMHKAAVLQRLELEASTQRLLAADIRIAVFITETDAGLVITGERLVQGEVASRGAWKNGGVIFDATEMHAYIGLTPAERRLFLDLKRIGGRR